MDKVKGGCSVVKSYVYYSLEGLEEGRISFFGLDYLSHDFLLVSIEDLRRDIEEQKMLLRIGFHPDGHICPWSNEEEEVVVVREGSYVWSSVICDYMSLDESFDKECFSYGN